MQNNPFLLVDAGPDFAPGHAAHLLFQMVCPGYVQAPRLVRMHLPKLLDAEHWDDSPRPVTEGPGHWSFGQTLLLTRHGEPCPPGRYEIQIEVEFPHAPAESLGRFLRTSLPFLVHTATGPAQNQKIEIIADDFSNIDVGQLAGFQHVVWKLGKNVNAFFDDVKGKSQATGEMPAHGKQPAESRCFPLLLKTNFDRQAELPYASKTLRPGPERQSIMLRCADGRRLILFAKDSLKVGRDREVNNDVLLRWVPVTEENRPITKQISREHFRLALTADGVQIEDLGTSWGTNLEGKALPPRQPTKINLNQGGAAITVARSFELRLHVYETGSPSPAHTVALGGAHAEAMGLAGATPLWKRAGHAGIEAVRLERVSNLHHEEYILLIREARIGSGPGCAIRIEGTGIWPAARIFYGNGSFWLERMEEDERVVVAGHELHLRELAPLAAGQTLQIGTAALTIEEPTQDLSVTS